MVCEMGLTGLPSLPSGSYFVPGVKLVVVPLLKHDLKDSLLHLLINGAVGILYPFADFPNVVIRVECDVLTHSCFPVHGDVEDLTWHVLDLKKDVAHGSVV